MNLLETAGISMMLLVIFGGSVFDRTGIPIEGAFMLIAYFSIGMLVFWFGSIKHKALYLSERGKMGKLYKVRVIDGKPGPTIAKMRVGDVGYTVPWALSYDDGEPYLDGVCTVLGKQFGTAKMMVKRTALGYVVDISNCDRDYWR